MCGFFWYTATPLNSWCNSGVAILIGPFLKAQHIALAPVRQYCQKSHIDELHNQVSVLERERDQLVSEIIVLEGTKKFAQETQELVCYKKRYKMDTYALAQIILKKLSEHEHYVLIDRGSHHGVQKDMVAVYKNTLIGRVTETYPYLSKVLLITDPLCKVAVNFTKTKASGIAEGICDVQKFVVEHANHLNSIKKGDYIISSGVGLVFPKGFGLGTVESFEKGGLFYTIIAKPLIPIDRIEYCYLIKKGSET